jgi:Uma2 family endonuclease
MATRTLLTFEEFEKYREDGKKHELLQGEHIILPPAKSPHSDVQHNLLRALQPYVDTRGLGDVRIEADFKLASDTWVQPDQNTPDGYFEGAPALAIEVASESDAAAQLDLKMELYFAHGASEVCVVYLQTHRVRAYFPDGHSETLAAELHSALFPGLSAPLSAIFGD